MQPLLGRSSAFADRSALHAAHRAGDPDEFDDIRDLIAREQGKPRGRGATRWSCCRRSTRCTGSPTTGREILAADASASPAAVRSDQARARRLRAARRGRRDRALELPVDDPARRGRRWRSWRATASCSSRRRSRCLIGQRIARVFERAGLPEGLLRVVHGGGDVGLALVESRVAKVFFTGSVEVGRGVGEGVRARRRTRCVELGGKDAMLVLADARLPHAVAGALWGGFAGAGPDAARAIERVYVRARGRRALRRRARRRRARPARRRPARLGHRGRPAGLARPFEHVRGAGRRRRRGTARRCAAAGRSARPGCEAGSVLRAGRAHRRDARDAHDARADRRPGARRDRPSTRVGEAIALANDSRLRARRVGVDARTATRRCASRASCTPGWCGSTTTCPARRVSRGPWGAAAGGGLGRTLGAAGLRACAQEKLITWDPPARARAVVGPVRRADLARGARGREDALRARGRPRARLAQRRARAGADRRRGRSGAGCRARRRDRPADALHRSLPSEACPPRPMQVRSASASCAGGSATRAACRGCSTPPSTSPA